MAAVRFTKDARKFVLARAREEVLGRGEDVIEAEHLLLSVADHPDLREFGLDRERLVAALAEEELRSLAAVGVSAREFDLSCTARRPRRAKLATSSKLALHRAVKLAVARGERRVSAHHVLWGVLAADHGRVPRALQLAGVDIGALRRRLSAASGAVGS
jgi:ATP-dependent Clp protease ATP-binding subunit ClpA